MVAGFLNHCGELPPGECAEDQVDPLDDVASPFRVSAAAGIPLTSGPAALACPGRASPTGCPSTPDATSGAWRSTTEEPRCVSSPRSRAYGDPRWVLAATGARVRGLLRLGHAGADHERR